jgi:ribonuclease E
MAETERDEKVSAGYRALGGEEPPRALDEAILAASRRSPTRWRLPLSVAAVLVLAVGVTLRLLPQRPDAESVALAPQVMETPRPKAPAPAAAPAREQPKPAARAAAAGQGGMRAEIGAKPGETTAARDSVAADAARSAPASAPALAAAGTAAESRVGAATAAKFAQSPLTPEAWLARIAELRKQGRKREADESLAEFRKRYPAYRIPEPLR